MIFYHIAKDKSIFLGIKHNQTIIFNLYLIQDFHFFNQKSGGDQGVITTLLVYPALTY